VILPSISKGFNPSYSQDTTGLRYQNEQTQNDEGVRAAQGYLYNPHLVFLIGWEIADNEIKVTSRLRGEEARSIARLLNLS
jgi:hypothetical protein